MSGLGVAIGGRANTTNGIVLDRLTPPNGASSSYSTSTFLGPATIVSSMNCGRWNWKMELVR
jgi:hypothetical protein